MKSVKNFVFFVIVLFSLAFNTFAGDIQTPGYAPPPPARATADADTIPNTEQDEIVTTETSDYLLYEALAALLSVY
jgi:hypothetical protein